MTEIIRLERVDIVFEPWEWPFARERRSEIDRHFEQYQRERPGIWNGRVLLLNQHIVADVTLRGTCFETDYASFLAWRDWHFPDHTVKNFFAAGVVRSSDDAFLLGEMATHTAAAGSIYFPCGTPEPDDLVAGRADLLGSVARELKEETGLDLGDFDAGRGWIMVAVSGYLALLKPLRGRKPADELCGQVLRYLANEPQPELSTIHLVRGPADLSPRMPPYVTAFLTDAWRQ